MLLLAIIFTWDGSQRAIAGHRFYLGWWSTCYCWPSFLPGMVVNMLLLAIIFTWDSGQHDNVGHHFYL